MYLDNIQFGETRRLLRTVSLMLAVVCIVNNTTNTSVIKHALVPNGWVVGGVGGVGWVVVVVVVGGRRQRCIVPSGR